MLAQPDSASEADVLKSQLLQLTPQFFALLDPSWQQFLAMPESLRTTSGHPDPGVLQPVLDRYQRVASDPQFQQLASRPEFQSVHGLLKHYQQTLVAKSAPLLLPPPPG